MTGKHEVGILDRQTLERSGTSDPHYVASDSKGNLYTAGGFRVQKCVYKGTGESRR